jgi:hypothetical protein
MRPSVAKVAFRHRLSNATPQELMNELQNLEALDENLAEFTEHFNARFAAAWALDPEVKSQGEARSKAVDGYNKSNAIVKAAKLLQESNPDARESEMILKKAQVMRDRFDRHVAAAEKIIQRIAKKERPKRLRLLATKAERAIKKMLVNPRDLKVMYWVNQGWSGVAYRISLGVHTGKTLMGVAMTQTIYSPDSSRDSDEVRTSIGSLNNLGGLSSGSSFDFDLQKIMSGFQELTHGWSGIKGEEDAKSSRKAVAPDIANALGGALRAMDRWDHRKAEINANFTEISGEYRSDLPKEGASDVGSDTYYDMVNDEISHWKRVLNARIKPYMKHIRRIDVQDGEKSWIHTSIILK